MFTFKINKYTYIFFVFLFNFFYKTKCCLENKMLNERESNILFISNLSVYYTIYCY